MATTVRGNTTASTPATDAPDFSSAPFGKTGVTFAKVKSYIIYTRSLREKMIEILLSRLMAV